MSLDTPARHDAQLEQELQAFRTTFAQLQNQLQEVIVGQEYVVQYVLMAVFLQGHVLLEGVPGLGKTLLMSSLGEVMGLHTQRVQFTPDLMPADILGTRVVQQDERGAIRFEFQKGPLFTQILLADEINRATPKTQSALLEAMQEKHATIGGTTHKLPEPFTVMATQNPLESDGTYPLPDAQLDRFLFKILVRFPTELELIEIIKRTTRDTIVRPRRVMQGAEQIAAWSKLIRRINITTPVLQYAARLLLATHAESDVGDKNITRWIRVGASPRGLQALVLAGKLRAALAGHTTVSRDDLHHVAKPCLRHRIQLTFEAEAEQVTPDKLIDQLIARMS